MKQTIYYLHSKWSLFSALWTYRLQGFEAIGNPIDPASSIDSIQLWQHHLALPYKDYVILFPYIVSVSGLLVNLKNKRLSIWWRRVKLGWRRRTIKDPINIVVYGASPEEFITILQQANPMWKQFLGSSHFLHGSTQQGWKASTAIKLDIDGQSHERHHIRLFGLKTSRGEKVTLAAAHRDLPNHAEADPPLSWNETRDLVASDLAASSIATICGLSEEVTRKDWRGAEGDGKILIVKMKSLTLRKQANA